MQYVSLVDELGMIRWVSATLPEVRRDDVIGKPAWNYASPQVAAEIQNVLVKTLKGEEVTHRASVMLAGRLRHFESRWQLAPLPNERLVVITTREIEPKFRRLSSKQVEVLRCLIECGSNVESSRKLGVSERTVESHLRNIRRTLGVATRPELIAFAMHHLGPL